MNDNLRCYRVFGSSSAVPDLSELKAVCGLATDVHGWYRAVFPLFSGNIEVDRWSPEDDGIRPELNTWAAWIEANGGPELTWLMKHVVSCNQLFTWSMYPAAAEAVSFSDMLCRFLCETTSGVYQVDECGFFQADGALLLPENP